MLEVEDLFPKEFPEEFKASYINIVFVILCDPRPTFGDFGVLRPILVVELVTKNPGLLLYAGSKAQDPGP